MNAVRSRPVSTPQLVALTALTLLACHQGGVAESGGNGGSATVCPTTWLEAPKVDGAISVPDPSAHTLAHAAANGSQVYECAPGPGDGGAAYAWAPRGPDATLTDCRQAPFGRHFASDAGPGEPEWQTLDGAYVVARKTGAFTVDKGSVPWLLLGVDGRGGSAPLARARYVQRVATSGGVAPSAPCDASHAGTRETVPYTADYFFFGP